MWRFYEPRLPDFTISTKSDNAPKLNSFSKPLTEKDLSAKSGTIGALSREIEETEILAK